MLNGINVQVGGDSADAAEQAWVKWRHRIYIGYAWAVAVALAGAFLESFHNLVDYSNRTGYTGLYSWVAPTMVDIFTVGGEVLVLCAVMNKWDTRVKVTGWLLTFLGLAASVAGNAGKNGWTVPGPGGRPQLIPLDHLVTYAVPPLAMAGLLAMGLMIIKRAWRPAPTSAYLGLPDYALAGLFHFPGVLRGDPVPSVATIKSTVRCGQPAAIATRDYLRGLRDALAEFAEPSDDSERTA